MVGVDKELSCNNMELLARSERFELPTLRFEVSFWHFSQAFVLTRLSQRRPVYAHEI